MQGCARRAASGGSGKLPRAGVQPRAALAPARPLLLTEAIGSIVRSGRASRKVSVLAWRTPLFSGTWGSAPRTKSSSKEAMAGRTRACGGLRRPCQRGRGLPRGLTARKGALCAQMTHGWTVEQTSDEIWAARAPRAAKSSAAAAVHGAAAG